MEASTTLQVLAVDDEVLNLTHLQACLGGQDDLRVVGVTGIAEAKTRLLAEPFDLVLVDLALEGHDGLDLVRWTRTEARLRDLPFLVLTARADKATVLRSFEAGALDYVVKPFHGPELAFRVRNQLNHRQALRALRDAAHHDPLTGVCNRRKAWEFMVWEGQRSRRRNRPITAVFFDIDRFKSVNDQYGHEAGDRCLKTVATALGQTLRGDDLLVRWGGEEFLVILPETDEAGAAIAAERLRLAVEDGAREVVPGGVTVSAGWAVKRRDEEWDEVLRKADLGLYAAKEAGRNCVRGPGV